MPNWLEVPGSKFVASSAIVLPTSVGENSQKKVACVSFLERRGRLNRSAEEWILSRKAGKSRRRVSASGPPPGPSTPSSSEFLRDVRFVRLGAPIAPGRPTDIALASSHAGLMLQLWSPRLCPCMLWLRTNHVQIPSRAHIEEFSLARSQDIPCAITKLYIALLSVTTSAAISIRRSPSVPAFCLYSSFHRPKAIPHVCFKQNGSPRIH